MTRSMLLVLALGVAQVGSAHARPASTGFYAEGGLGAVYFLPPDGGNAAVD